MGVEILGQSQLAGSPKIPDPGLLFRGLGFRVQGRGYIGIMEKRMETAI